MLIVAITAPPKEQGLLLFMDYDGTLVEIAPRPEMARPSQELHHVLAHLTSLPGLPIWW
jgi:trehalose-6-phosphatase